MAHSEMWEMPRIYSAPGKAGGKDGYLSLEVKFYLAHDTEAI